MELRNKIQEIMKAVFSLKDLENLENVSIDTVENWDSLRHINLILALEEAFEVQFSDDNIAELLSFEEIEKQIKILSQ